MAPAKQVKRCDMSTSKFTTIDAFFINVNKSSVPAIVPEQSESASQSLLCCWRSIMLMCLPLVTKTLLYCRPPLALFEVAKRDRGRRQN